MTLVLVAAAAWLVWLTRGTTLWFDEWVWAIGRRDWTAHAFLAPHNGHLSLVPVAVYKLLFATLGITHSAPYRVLGVGAHLLCVLGLYLYGAPRTGRFTAALGALVLLFLGAAWQDILWPFQIGFLTSLWAGVFALLALDRRDRAGDVAACLLLAISLASSGLGLVFVVGLAVDLCAGRRRSAAWIVVAPLALYVIWWVAYQDTGTTIDNVWAIPVYAADSVAAALSALTGLTKGVPADDGTALGWGRPLAVVALAGLAWWLPRLRPPRPRLLAVLAMPLAFWALTGLARAHVNPPTESRYVYVGALLVLLLVAELAAGRRLPAALRPLAAAVVIVVIVSGLGSLRDAGTFLRGQSLITRADLAAAELAPARPGAVLQHLPGYPLVVIPVAAYLDAARDLGSPAATQAELATAPEDVREKADAELIQLRRVAVTPGDVAPAGAAPNLEVQQGGTAAPSGSCVAFTPAAAGATTPALELELPPTGLRITAAGAPATVRVRRFGSAFAAPPVSRVAAGATGSLKIAADRSPAPWHVRVEPGGRVRACTLG
jgi:hypothetical protein